MRSVYLVSYEEWTKYDRKTATQEADGAVNVIAHCAEGAIKKVRSYLIGKKRQWDDDKGKLHVGKVEDIIVTSVSHVATIDF